AQLNGKATAAQGVTNGDSHDHSGGDGAQIDHVHLANIGTNSHTQIDTFIASKSQANGLAALDANGKVPNTQLPSYVDDVEEYADLASFPATGETGKIYVAKDTNKTYRWSGSAYVYITSGAVDSVAGKTGVVTLVKADVGLSNVDNTSDANKPISTATQTALDGKENFHGIEAYGNFSFDNSTHILSLSSVTYWYKGAKYTTASPVTCDLDSYVTLAANTLYYLFFDAAAGLLKAGTSVNLKEQVPICTVFWNGSAGLIGRETHSHTRDIDWHQYAHQTIGARYQAGLDQSAPSTALDNTINLGGGTIWDEDQQINITSQTTAIILYRNGVSSYTFDSTPSALPYKWNSGTSKVQYLDTDTYALADLTNAQYMPVWVYATNCISTPIWIVVGEAASPYTTLAAARNATPPALTGFNLTPEMKLLYRWIFDGSGQFQETVDYRQASSLPAGGTAASSAASVTVTPTGSISATNVQAAIEELDSEKASATHNHDVTYAPIANGVTNG
ncbi:MAG: hypothetical protein ACRCWC_11455, partial [Plesiomonas shigelloides]